MDAERHRQLGWTDPNRIDDDRAHLADGYDARLREHRHQGPRAAPATGNAARGRWSVSPHCTDRERADPWPIG